MSTRKQSANSWDIFRNDTTPTNTWNLYVYVSLPRLYSPTLVSADSAYFVTLIGRTNPSTADLGEEIPFCLIRQNLFQFRSRQSHSHVYTCVGASTCTLYLFHFINSDRKLLDEVVDIVHESEGEVLVHASWTNVRGVHTSSRHPFIKFHHLHNRRRNVQNQSSYGRVSYRIFC